METSRVVPTMQCGLGCVEILTAMLALLASVHGPDTGLLVDKGEKEASQWKIPSPSQVLVSALHFVDLTPYTPEKLSS
ncbi:hypothetical protein BDN70DRAFT_881889 [Pholiota conissans]|uniref:Uncharacterized protein n=1 Tax=Pholiota conissans TaxID=109636 RepID=A0A9P5YZQ3_9AGAR|nr:hypothetical protein BDN70DRAFT_881889 [Pholiota conissans]